MSMTTYVVGFRPPDETFRKMKEAHDACLAAGIDPPREVDEFFNHARPDPRGVVIELNGHPAVTSYEGDMVTGYEVDLTKLPPGITTIRFVNSW